MIAFPCVSMKTWQCKKNIYFTQTNLALQNKSWFFRSIYKLNSQFWIDVLTVHTERARIDPDCQFACVILSNTNVWTGVGNGSCIYVATKVTAKKIMNNFLQSNMIEPTCYKRQTLPYLLNSWCAPQGMHQMNKKYVNVHVSYKKSVYNGDSRYLKLIWERT